ncbi:MAG TPA: sulfite reductase subunit alpha [Chthoniobacterales bacterium]|nr:sulfite reductase subunit alpha [Chthoniobacterales bacterium]
MSTEGLYSRKNPFPATMTVNRKLTLGGSEKDTRHFEISLAGSGLDYEVGDSLGVFPSNEPALVEKLLETLGFSGDEVVPNADKVPTPIREALLKSFVITSPDKKLLGAIAEKDSSAEFLKDLLDPAFKTNLDEYLWGRDVLDPLLEFTAAKFTPEEFAGYLRKLQPRLYSIASSRKVVGENVHLTVAVVRYNSYNRPRAGVASSFLAERSEGEGAIPVFYHTAKHFRVPEDPATNMIMVGPGTGIAPFRAMIQERAASGASGKNWLFFGEQRSASDFFYREEFEKYQADGVLSTLDTAFSRDQDFKIYVQHRILEKASELYDWFEKGAIFYICGDAARMAKDVDTALHEVVQKAGGKTPEQAIEYIDALKKAKRYRKDVY